MIFRKVLQDQSMNRNQFQHILQSLHFGWRRKIPQILQTEAAECGLACLTMICRYYGMNVDLFSLRNQIGVSSHGVTLATLINMSASVHLISRPLSLDLNEIKQLKTPCILHWDLNHFVVLVAVKRNKFILHDPAFGRREVGLNEMSKHFSGIALELWPDKEFKPRTERSQLSLLKMLFQIDGLKGFLVKILSLSLIIESINLLLPVGTQLVMDHVIMAKDHSLLGLICVGLLFFILFRTFIAMLRSWSSLIIGSLVDIQWKAGLFGHLMKLPLSYFEKRKLGDIQSRFSSLEIICTTLTNNIVKSIINILMSIGVFIMMFLYGGWLVWIVCGFTLIYIILRVATYQRYRQASEEKIVKEAKANSHFMESLYGIDTLKSLRLTESRAQYWLNMNIDTTNANIRLTKLEMIFGGVNTLIMMIEQTSILWIGAALVMDDKMTLGMFIAFTAYRAQFSEQAANLINMVLDLKMLNLHTERLTDIVLTDTENDIESKYSFPKDIPVEFELRDIAYQYDNLSKPIFTNINMKIQAGESVAIIGPSGAGKTTLMKVMNGLLTPTHGEVLINGIDIYKFGVNNYRDIIGSVLQNDKLFAGSISDNISSFDTEKNYEWLVECAKYCNIHNEIMSMPMGYETLVSELGNSLSGGQKQRLLIARALYRKPCLLFLDEATSHLDEDNEFTINKAISSLKITRIIIAHRKSTIESANRIVEIGSINH